MVLKFGFTVKWEFLGAKCFGLNNCKDGVALSGGEESYRWSVSGGKERVAFMLTLIYLFEIQVKT